MSSFLWSKSTKPWAAAGNNRTRFYWTGLSGVEHRARSGDLGYTSGTTEDSIKDESGKTKSDKGKYLTVWKKQANSEWKVLYDMFSSDLPTMP